MIQFQENAQTDGRTKGWNDGQTLSYRTLFYRTLLGIKFIPSLPITIQIVISCNKNITKQLSFLVQCFKAQGNSIISL